MSTKADLQAKVVELEKDNQALKKLLARAERELNDKLHPEELPSLPVPYLITCQMKYYRMSWEPFWCYEHLQWCDELDSSFPYSMADNSCPVCRGAE